MLKDNKYKVFSVILLTTIISLSGPSFAFAAFDDVTLTTDTVISSNGVSLDISGSSATVASIEVNSASFSAVLNSGSTITVSSSNLYDIPVSPANLVTSETCSSTESSITITATETVTITITPTTDACWNPVVSSGGGGKVISLSPKSKVELEPEPESETLTSPDEDSVAETPTTISTTPVLFTTTLRRGVQNTDVKRLQQLLNSDLDTQISSAGVGSVGNETNYFGSLTERAVQKFQVKYGIVSSGTPSTTGYGLVGPQTILKLNEVSGGEVVTVTIESSTIFSRNLNLGILGEDVIQLQQVLNSDTDTQVVSVGAGSSGQETNYYGSLTERAVQKFQIKHGIVSDATNPGYGFVGPKTRAKLQELF